jgi:hypothetical protein
VVTAKAGCGLTGNQAGIGPLDEGFFMVWSAITDRGDLFQIAAPAIKALPLNRRFICVSSIADPATSPSLSMPILTIECCPPLLFAMQELAWEKKVELNEDGSASALLTALQDDDFGWKEWIRLEGEDGLNWFRSYIDEKWLHQKVNWGYVDYFPKHYSGVAVAKQYFEGLDDKTLDALGVEIIEGEHPGSSYYAAELRQDIDYANQVARDMELEFRFSLMKN